MAKDKSKQDEFQSIQDDISTLDFDVPQDILAKIKKQLELEKERPEISPSTLSKELMSIAPELKRKMNISIAIAAVSEIFNFASYFFGAYAAMWVYNFYKSGTGEYGGLIKYGSLTFLCIIIHLILSGISTTLSHQTAFSILAKLRLTLFEKLSNPYSIYNRLESWPITSISSTNYYNRHDDDDEQISY